MELSWLMRLRIAAVVAVGLSLVGLLAWPLAKPADPLGPVITQNLSPAGAITLAILALVAGLLAYFLSWPYGRQIAILAVPAGLALWAIRSGNMASFLQQNPAFQQRLAIFHALKWTPIFWLAIVAAGCAGTWLAEKIARPKIASNQTEQKPNSNRNTYLNAAVALLLSAVIAHFALRLFAQDVKVFDSQLGTIVGQPATGQIIFAVMVSFGLAAFVVKVLLNASYLWPIITTALLTTFGISVYTRENILQSLVQRWPPVFFPKAVIAILPVQMVAFGTLGSIIGYWLAISYVHWRKSEAE